MSYLKSMKLHGALIAIALAAFAFLLLWPTGSRIFQVHQETKSLGPLIERHYASLAKALPANPYQNHAVFIASKDIILSSDNISADIQAKLIDTLKANQTRLIDLRQNTSDETINGLQGLSFTLSFEGDLQAVFTTLSKLTETPWPLLVETMDVTAEGPDDRPDRKVRITLTLKIWTEQAA